MKTHNACMYHCLTCGNVVHCERKPRPPQCCHHEMVMAAAETIIDREETQTEETARVRGETAAPVAKPR